MLGIAEYSREITRARTRAAMRRYQREGRRMGGNCPFGWKRDPDDDARMTYEPKEREIIDMIVMYYEQGNSLREIARKLVQGGVRNRLGGPWHHYQVRRILEREGVYTGRVVSED